VRVRAARRTSRASQAALPRLRRLASTRRRWSRSSWARCTLCMASLQTTLTCHGAKSYVALSSQCVRSLCIRQRVVSLCIRLGSGHFAFLGSCHFVFPSRALLGSGHFTFHLKRFSGQATLHSTCVLHWAPSQYCIDQSSRTLSRFHQCFCVEVGWQG
jgi:hypothetical protein